MNNGNYAERQHQRDREYAEAWKKLSAKERKQLQEAGITGPQMPGYKTGKGDQQSLLESCPVPEIPSDENNRIHSQESESLMAMVARRIVGELLAQDNIRLAAECLAIVTGVAYAGNSMTEIAKKHGVTRASVSKRCVAISNALALPPTRVMRKLTTRTTYERRARDCHRRDDH